MGGSDGSEVEATVEGMKNGDAKNSWRNGNGR